MRETKRKKNEEQKSKQRHKHIKPDLWQRKGFEPHWKLKSVSKREDYERRCKAPEGAGTGRAMGSNKRLRILLSFA